MVRWGHRSGWPGDVVARAHAAIGQDEADGVVDLTSGDLVRVEEQRGNRKVGTSFLINFRECPAQG